MWLSLAAILIAQLNPPPPILQSSKAEHGHEGRAREAQAQAIVGGALPVLLECSLNAMSLPGAMQSVGFFGSLFYRNALNVEFVGLRCVESGYCTGVFQLYG